MLWNLCQKVTRHLILALQVPLRKLELLTRIHPNSVYDIPCDNDIPYPFDDVDVSKPPVEPTQEATEIIGEEGLAADVQIRQHHRIHPA